MFDESRTVHFPHRKTAFLECVCGLWVCGITCACFRARVRACAMLCLGVLFFFIKTNVFISTGTVMITKNFNIYSARSTTLSKIRDPEMLLLPGYPGHWPLLSL